MRRAKTSCKASSAPKRQAAKAFVSIRTIYADALREVMADPRKAIAEHDPWLADLMRSSTAPKS
jgi:hypothetical protein